MTDLVKRTIDFIKKNPKMTRDQVAEGAGVGLSTVDRARRELGIGRKPRKPSSNRLPSARKRKSGKSGKTSRNGRGAISLSLSRIDEPDSLAAKLIQACRGETGAREAIERVSNLTHDEFYEIIS